jgi:hypothetical protein
MRALDLLQGGTYDVVNEICDKDKYLYLMIDGYCIECKKIN